ncbi:hypothetical protein BpHYR1_016777 [Brachionus plicatilis]|uniref:Uncharacterized protein n=1 Tax=Brachionus plicatilis TaxID=10195 RepID=A0A3M7PNF8_BRAPC|nr:hypothetical protein BpHYR1_016777 [Brachionus plicatilis]
MKFCKNLVNWPSLQKLKKNKIIELIFTIIIFINFALTYLFQNADLMFLCQMVRKLTISAYYKSTFNLNSIDFYFNSVLANQQCHCQNQIDYLKNETLINL